MTLNIGWKVERLENFEYLTQGKDKIIVQNVRGHDISANFFFRGFPWSLGQYLLARICLRGTRGECDLLQLRPLASKPPWKKIRRIPSQNTLQSHTGDSKMNLKGL